MPMADDDFLHIMALTDEQAICDLEQICQQLQLLKAQTETRREYLAKRLAEDQLRQQLELNRMFSNVLTSTLKQLEQKSEKLQRLESTSMHKQLLEMQPENVTSPPSEASTVVIDVDSQRTHETYTQRSAKLTHKPSSEISAELLTLRLSLESQASKLGIILPADAQSKNPIQEEEEEVQEEQHLVKAASSRHISRQISLVDPMVSLGRNATPQIAPQLPRSKQSLVIDPIVQLGRTRGQQRSELLVKCQSIMRIYGIPMYEFCESWTDGHAFCALMHYYQPQLVDTNYIKCKDPALTLQYVAELTKSLGVKFEGNLLRLHQMKRPSFLNICNFVQRLVARLQELQSAEIYKSK
ncbi:hypothetical protein KR222_010662 [Zaprionus bogoriensis]|nr:hypothetical protein KR222_010662 [Zaprionus bogoriensis]